MQCSNRQDDTLGKYRMKRKHEDEHEFLLFKKNWYLGISLKITLTHLCSHKSAHIYAIEESKDDRNDNHYARNGKDG